MTENITFADLGLSDAMLKALEKKGYGYPTTIQQLAIPSFMQWKDVIAKAPTGTGKTFAFGIPMIEHVDPQCPDVQGLILAPTRELAIQIGDELRGLLTYYQGIRVAVLYGGAGIVGQAKQLEKKPQIVVATPGRLMDHYNRKNIRLDKIQTVVLDEADRMLDMGFYDDIMQIVKFLPKERQTIMFSATMPAKIQQLAGNILNNPAEVKLAVSKPAEKIVQAAYVCYENQKLGIIRSLFAEETPERVIIFASSKLKVKEVTKALKQMKLNVGEMHSDLEQAQREEVMYEFKAGRINILVATDIVARGIDIDDIRLVINYDVPHDSEDYVHRIGRTARANNDGVAITFVSEKEQGSFKNIEKFLDRDIYKIPVPEELGEAPEYKPRAFDGGGRRGGHGNGRKPGGNKNGRNNSKGGKPRAKRPQNGSEKK